MVRTGVDSTKFFIVLLLSFVAIQITSWVLAELDIYPLIKMGWVLLFFVSIIGIISLFILGRKIGELKLKEDGIFILLIFLAIVAAFLFLPDYLPQIFSSYSIGISETIKKSAGVILGVPGW